jgi:uncharacterized membrane protein
MRPPFYLRQLALDLDRWIADGLVPAENREHILAAAGVTKSRHALPIVFSILGVVLLGAAAMSFVAANWSAMGKPERLLVLFGAMAAAGAIAAFLYARALKLFADAASLMTVIMFGVAIMFIGQTYHIETGWEAGLAMWATGALIAALVVPSRAALSVALVIGTVWTITATYESPGAVHWPYLAFLAAAVAGRIWRGWQSEFHLAMASFLFWLGFNFAAIGETFALTEAGMVALTAAVFLGLWLIAHTLDAISVEKMKPYEQAQSLARYGIVGAFILFFMLQLTGADRDADASAILSAWFVPGGAAFAAIIVLSVLAATRRALSALDLLAAVVFAATALAYPAWSAYAGEDSLDLTYTALLGAFIVWGIAHAARVDDRLLINLGFAGFAAWTLYLYAGYFSSLFDQAAFFAVGGILLVGIGAVLEMARRRVIRHAEAR